MTQVRVTLTVGGRDYVMACNEGEEEHLLELGAFLDREVEQLQSNFGQVGDNRLLLMAGLVAADKLSEALQQIEDLNEKNTILSAERDKALSGTENVEDMLAEKLETAAERVESILKSVKE